MSKQSVWVKGIPFTKCPICHADLIGDIPAMEIDTLLEATDKPFDVTCSNEMCGAAFTETMKSFSVSNATDTLGGMWCEMTIRRDK